MKTGGISSSGVRRAQVEVILGALAFALSVPLARTLLRDVQPLALSAGLYLAAGMTLLSLWFVSVAARPREARPKNALRGQEWLWLGLATLAGGVLGPMALFFGLKLIPGHVAGLLLNFEAVFTIGLGVLFHGERVGRRGWLGAGAVLLGAVLLSWPQGREAGAAVPFWGVVLVVLACASWGLDNNLIQRVSLRDSRQVVGIKGLAGGLMSLVLALALGQLGGWTVARALVVVLLGVFSYGVSIVLFVRGLRTLGVIQTGTLFALAPGFAAVLSFMILHEPLTAAGFLALAGMTAGALLLATDRHEHVHRHEALEHDHPHVHDEHHQHEHTPEQLSAKPHAHPHRHEPLTHAHPHVHDVHHRHAH